MGRSTLEGPVLRLCEIEEHPFRVAGYMYILECSDGSYYVGSTVDLGRRLEEHALGMAAAYTRRRRPVRLVYVEEFASVVDAFAFEKRVQGWSRRKREALIEGRREDCLDSRVPRAIPAKHDPVPR